MQLDEAIAKFKAIQDEEIALLTTIYLSIFGSLEIGTFCTLMVQFI